MLSCIKVKLNKMQQFYKKTFFFNFLIKNFVQNLQKTTTVVPYFEKFVQLQKLINQYLSILKEFVKNFFFKKISDDQVFVISITKNIIKRKKCFNFNINPFIKINNIMDDVTKIQNLAYSQKFPIRSMQNPEYHDYVIIGAGISGLQAAQILAENQQDFIVLQASDKTGGRMATDYLCDIVKEMSIKYEWVNNDLVKKVPIEIGATWVSNQHLYLMNLIRELGLTLFCQYFDGKTIYGIDNGNYSYIQSMVQYYRPHKLKICKLLDKIDNLSLNLQNFEKNKAANISFYNEYLQMYDKVSIYQFIQSQFGDADLTDLVCREIETMQCISCKKISILTYIMDSSALQFLKFYAQKANTMVDGMRIKQGTVSIIKGLVQKINKTLRQQDDNEFNIHQRDNSFLKLSSPVSEIVNEITKQVLVRTKNNEYFSCKKIFFAVPIAVASKIKISKISQSKQLIFRNQQFGLITRKYYIFKQAFWRVHFSGNASFSKKFPFHQMTELSPKNLVCGVLAFVFVQKRYEQFKEQLSKQLRKNQTIEEKQDQYFKKIIADMFKIPIDSEHLRETITYTRTFTYNQYIQAAYQSTTKPTICELVQALGDDYKESYYRDQYNVIYIGSQYGSSDQFGTYMQGGIRAARAKVHKILGIKDTLKF